MRLPHKNEFLRGPRVRWSFLGGVFLSKVRGFFNVARSPLPHYQIADLESFSCYVIANC